MQTYLLSFSTIAPLFLLIFFGVLFSRTKSFKKEWIDVLNDYALWIGFPALILIALIKLDVPVSSYIGLTVANSIYIILSMFLAFPVGKLLKLKSKTTQTLVLAFSFGNVAYLGIPVLVNVYGEEALAEATMLSAVYLFWLFTLGVILIESMGGDTISSKKIVLSLVKNPLLLAVIIGLLISIFKMKMPGILLQSLDLLASSVTAIVLFSLGLFLGSNPLGNLKEWLPVFYLTIAILLVLPLLYLGVLRLSGVAFDYRSSVLDAAMPMGLTPYVLAVKYKLDATLASRVVVLSTSIAILTLPLWVIILG